MGARCCVLHIGICKTGTTSIQYALNANRSNLSKAGITVGRTYGPTHNHRHLTLLGVLEGSEAGKREWEILRSRDPGLRACRNLAEGRRWIEDKIGEELESAPTENLVLFSSEQLSQRLIHDEEISRLREALERVGLRRVRIVIYLREQVGLALSWESMETIAGQHEKDFKQIEHHLDHKRLLERWERIWGREALLVRTYSRIHLEKGDILNDFKTYALGMGNDMEWLSEQPMRNSRLGKRGLWAMRQADVWLPKILPDRSSRCLRERLLQVTRHGWIGGAPKEASREQIERMAKLYQEKNRWVDARFGTYLESSFGQT